MFQEEPIDVVLRFAPEAADDAAGCLFHPSQNSVREPDGSLIVRVHARGAQEMCWHLFTGGTDVSIAPHALRSTMAEMAAEIAQQHAKPSVPTS
jgi:predicted DNA-binding transcriptional regulator YafY